jgi:DNA-binding NarL/FixJ family response regulator
MTITRIDSNAGPQPVVALRGEHELLARAGHLFAAREEFACAAADLSTFALPGPRAHSLARLREHIGDDVVVRKMFSPAAVADPEHVRELLAMSALGATVRICPTELPHETIVIDRRVAVLAGDRVDGVRGYSVVTAPDVVAGIHSLYLTAWQAATDLADFLPARPPSVDEAGLAILRLLSSGRKDEAAARSLGVSLRTYRRRVADLMALLGAESRFQAGVRARALGLRF